ncbi:hypothetical protein [Haladaptatus sp. DFWS20]
MAKFDSSRLSAILAGISDPRRTLTRSATVYGWILYDVPCRPT